MNTKSVAFPLLAAFLALPCVAMAASPYGEGFISGQIGQSTLQGMTASQDTATGSALMGGYRWNINPMFQLGAEVGYANIGTYRDSYGGTSATAKLEGYLAGVTGKVNLDPNWYLSFEGGYFGAKQSTRGSTFVGPNLYAYGQNHTKGSWYSGIGFGYDFNRTYGIGVNYNYFADNDGQVDLGSNMVSVRMEVRF